MSHEVRITLGSRRTRIEVDADMTTREEHQELLRLLDHGCTYIKTWQAKPALVVSNPEAEVEPDSKASSARARVV